MVQKWLLAALVGAVFVASTTAHEIKVLASNQALSEAGRKTTVYLSWGHRIPVDEFIDASSLARYELLGPDGKGSALKAEGKSLQANIVEVEQEGTHQVVVARKSSVFTYVIDDEGRRQLKRGPKSDYSSAKIDSASRSTQTAKAIITVGKLSDKAPAAVGLPVEIVPLDGPAKWTSGGLLRFRLLQDGKPLASASVTARYVGFKPDEGWCYATSSNRAGEFSIKACQAGTWVIKAQSKGLASGKDRESFDFDSYTTTLSLEVGP